MQYICGEIYFLYLYIRTKAYERQHREGIL